MINLGLPLERYILPIAIGSAGLVLAWLAKQPSGLLVSVAAVITLGGRRASLLSAGAFALALAAFILVVGWDSIARPEADLQIAVFLAAGLGISGLIHLHQIASSSNRDESEARLILESMPGHGWSADQNGRLVYVSPSALKYFGPAENLDRIERDVIGWRQIVHTDDYDRFVATWLQSLKTGEPYENEHRICRFDGEYRWFSSSGKPSRDSSGRITGWHGTSIDIHEQKTAEFALRESERRYRELFRYMPIGLAQVDASKLVPMFKELRAQGVTDLQAYIDEHPEFLPRAVEALEVEEVNQHIIEMFGAKNAQEMSGPITRYWQPGISTIRRSIEGRYRGQEVLQEETKVARMDGSVIDVLFTTARPSAIADKSLVGFIDITERKKAEQALRDRERELSQLVDMVPSQVWRLRPDGEPTFYNKRLVDFVGLDVAAMDRSGMSRLATAITALVHPDDRASLEEALSYSLANGERFSMRFRQRRADGVYRWFESRAEPLRDDCGVILEWYGTNVDIDDLVRAQEALRDRERELSQLVDMAPSLIWRLTPDGEPTFFNKRMVDFHCMDVADLDKPGMSRLEAVLETVHPDDVAEYREALNRCLITGEPFSMRYRLRRADGVYRWMSSRAEPMRDQDGRIVQWYGLYHDIDDQTRLYGAVAEREARIRRLIDSDIIGIVIWDLDGTLIDANDAFLRMVQYERTDLEAGLRWFDMTPPDWQKVYAREEAEELATTGKMQAREKEYFRKDGSRVPVLIGAACFEGQSRQGVAYILDLTERKRSERELQQLVDALTVHIWSWTPDGKLAYVNKRSLEDLGLSGANFEDITRVAQALVHPEDAPEVLRRSAYCLETGDSFLMRYRRRWKDGSYRWIEARCEPLRDRDGTIVHWYQVSIDIDGEVRAQEALRLAGEKMALASQAASLAELSASIAHEVNQPLAAIVATSHACRRWLSADPPNLERAAITLERIIRDANSASEVVSRIRALFSQMGRARSPADLAGVIGEVCRLMADELAAKNIRIKADIDRGLPAALIDRIQIQQVLVNLIRNAVDSMDTAVDDARLIRLCAVPDGDNAIRIEVHDLGAGMKEPERVFEPFFTTKENGMGMGLAICRSIIEAHDGRLWAASNEPRGTTLAFTLPIRARDAA
jgi:PAS domain S-box-containing protein